MVAMTDRSGSGTGDARSDVLVVGVGNDLRGDDGAGRAVVEELAARAVSGMRVIWSHQLVPELAEQIATVDLVIFVDAGHPGTTSTVDVRPLPPGSPSLGAHQAAPAGLLGLAALAGLPVPQAWLVTVPAHDFGLGTRLSPGTRAAVDDAVIQILRLAEGGHRAERGPDGAS